jgi:4-aminobutyrate aminotransferase-like enzyme
MTNQENSAPGSAKSNSGETHGPSSTTQAAKLLSSKRYLDAKRELLSAIKESASRLNQVSPSSPAEKERYATKLTEFTKDRGRELYFPLVTSGLGNGPFVELDDGSVKYDMITGIGINFLGHTHPELIEEIVDALPSDVMQGNLEPGHEARDLMRTLLSRVGEGCRLNHFWLTCSGTMANEIALKIIRQKKQPATRVLAFSDCFAGRSTAMQEVTDNPKYREGQPVYGEVDYLPHYDSKRGLAESIERTVGRLNEATQRYPGKFAALMMELIQGEGGFNYGPTEYYVRVFEAAKKAGLAIWADEIQTFGRTGELFAYQKLGLNPWVDVVTVGKTLQACGVLYTDEYNPKPGLVAGTFSGSSVALRAARRTLELFDQQLLGPSGKIERLSKRFTQKLNELKTGDCQGMIGEIRSIGGMIAFEPFDGKMETMKPVLMSMFDRGVIGFYCGHGPFLIRMLPPLAVMDERQVDEVCALIGMALKDTDQKLKKV